jgi:hypothetical protein
MSTSSNTGGSSAFRLEGERSVTQDAASESSSTARAGALKHFEEWLSGKGCSAWGEEWPDPDAKERFFCEAVLFDLFANWFLELPLRFKNPHTGKYEYKACNTVTVLYILKRSNALYIHST